MKNEALLLRLVDTRRPCFGKIALRMGAVTEEELSRAQQLRREREWEDLEEILVEMGVLSAGLAEGVRTAWLRARSECPHCGRRTDLRGWRAGERGCSCLRGADGQAA